MMNVPMVEWVAFSFPMDSAESVNLSVTLFLPFIARFLCLLQVVCPVLTSGWG